MVAPPIQLPRPTDAVVGPRAAESPESMAMHSRILALNDAWKEKYSPRAQEHLDTGNTTPEIHESGDNTESKETVNSLTALRHLNLPPSAAPTALPEARTEEISSSRSANMIPCTPRNPLGVPQTPVPLPSYSNSQTPMSLSSNSNSQTPVPLPSYSILTLPDVASRPIDRRNSGPTPVVAPAHADSPGPVSYATHRPRSLPTSVVAPSSAENHELSSSIVSRPSSSASKAVLSNSTPSHASRLSTSLPLATALPPLPDTSRQIPAETQRDPVVISDDETSCPAARSPSSDASSIPAEPRDSGDWASLTQQEVEPVLSQAMDQPEQGTQIRALLGDASGRPYNVLRAADGSSQICGGVLIPTNYKLHEGDHKYVCPIRDCQTLLDSTMSFMGHFSAKHCYSLFNDNLDGTLSLVSRYKNPTSKSPGIVISRSPLPPDAPPPIEPRVAPLNNAQIRRRQQLETRRSSSSSSGRPIKSETVQHPVESNEEQYRRSSARSSLGATFRSLLELGPASASASFIASDISNPMPADDGSMNASQYLNSLLSPLQRTPKDREDVQYMMHLQPCRGFPDNWLERHRGTKLPPNLYAISLAFLVGSEIERGRACPSRKTELYLYDPGVTLPVGMPLSAKRAFYKEPTCIGCAYRSYVQRRKNDCEWGRGFLQGNKKMKRASSDDTDPLLKEEASTAESPMSAVPSNPQERKPKRPAGEADLAGPAPKASRLSFAERAEVTRLEMEQWEMAPGVVTEAWGNENVAFSGSFLDCADPVAVMPDIGIHVVVIRPGGRRQWNAEPDKARACTAAGGKVRVTVGDTSFLLGPNGAFCVKPEQSCLVENPFHVEATIHCFVVQDYALVANEL